MKRRSGFTFVEAMVALLLMGLLLAGGYRMLQSGRRISSRQTQNALLQNEVRRFMMRFEKDIHEAYLFKEIDCPKAINHFSAEDGILRKIVFLTPAGEVTYEFSAKDRALYRQQEGAAKVPLMQEQVERVQLWGIGIGAPLPPKGSNKDQTGYYNALNLITYGWGMARLSDVMGVLLRVTFDEFEEKSDGVSGAGRKVLRTHTIETKIYSRTLLFQNHLSF